MEKKEKLPAAFQKVGHRTFKEHHAPQSPLGLSRPAMAFGLLLSESRGEEALLATQPG